jgi:hypothetical protein
MGTWGVKIFDSDLALDMRAAFSETWHEFKNDDKATKAFLKRWSEGFADPEDGRCFGSPLPRCNSISVA